jgi:hypothetical protein
MFSFWKDLALIQIHCTGFRLESHEEVLLAVMALGVCMCVCVRGWVGRSGLKAARSSFRITSGYKEECCYTSMDPIILFPQTPHTTQFSSFVLSLFFAHGAKFEPQDTLLLVSFGG